MFNPKISPTYKLLLIWALVVLSLIVISIITSCSGYKLTGKYVTRTIDSCNITKYKYSFTH